MKDMKTNYTLGHRSSKFTNKLENMKVNSMIKGKHMDGEFLFQRMVINTKAPSLKIHPVVTNM